MVGGMTTAIYGPTTYTSLIPPGAGWQVWEPDTHYDQVVLCGSLKDIAEGTPQVGQHNPGSLVVGWVFYSQPFIEHDLAPLGALDILCVPSISTRVLIEQHLLATGVSDRHLFRVTRGIRVVQPYTPGVVHEFEAWRKEPSKEDLKAQLYAGKVGSDDLLVWLPSVSEGFEAQSLALGCIPALESKLGKRVVGVVDTDVDDLVIDGVGVEPGENLLRIKAVEDPRYVLNSMDIVLDTSMATVWPSQLVRGMSCGVLGVGPEEHTWGDVLDDGRGVPVVTSAFGRCGDRYYRSMTPDGVANAVSEALAGPWQTSAQKAMRWAHTTTGNADTTEAAWKSILGLQ